MNVNPYQSPSSRSAASRRSMRNTFASLGLLTLLSGPFPAVMLFSWLHRASLWRDGLWFLPANAIAIVVSIIAIVCLFRWRQMAVARSCLLILIVLLIASLVPLWFKHLSLESRDLDPHWHNYWQMNHIH